MEPISNDFMAWKYCKVKVEPISNDFMAWKYCSMIIKVKVNQSNDFMAWKYCSIIVEDKSGTNLMISWPGNLL